MGCKKGVIELQVFPKHPDFGFIRSGGSKEAAKMFLQDLPAAMKERNQDRGF